MLTKPREIGIKYIETIISRDGSMKVVAHGFTGKVCREATKGLEISLGTVTGRKEDDGKFPRQTVR
jgi:hypothetical protein